MTEILRYVLIGPDNVEEDYEYATLAEAKSDATQRKGPTAIIMRTYVYDDSELVWTPDGSAIWPPMEAKA